jgi:hypothetical protein
MAFVFSVPTFRARHFNAPICGAPSFVSHAIGRNFRVTPLPARPSYLLPLSTTMELCEGDAAPRFADAPTSGGGSVSAADLDPFSIVYFYPKVCIFAGLRVVISPRPSPGGNLR